MSLSVGEALAKCIKDTNLVAGRVFERGLLAKFGEKPKLPYVTWQDPISDLPALQGDCDVLAEERLVQVSLWQKMSAIDPELYRSLKAALRAADLNDADSVQFVQAVRVIDAQSLDDPDPGLIQHAITVRVVCAP